MEIVIVILAFLGISAGTLIAHLSKEEMKDGAPYFIFLRYAALFILLTTLLATQLPLLIAFILAFIISEILTINPMQQFTYAILGCLLYLASFTMHFPIAAVLCFIFGLASAAMDHTTFTQHLKIMNITAAPFLVAIILFVVF